MKEEGRNFIISITSGSIVRAVLLIVLFLVLYLIKDIVLVVLAAVVLASAIEPGTKWLIKYRFRRLPAVITIYLSLATALVIFFLFFLPSLLSETLVYMNSLPQNISLTDLWNPIQESGALGGVPVSSLPSQTFAIQDLVSGLKTIVSGTGEGVIKTASVIFGGALSFILIVVFSFYLSVQEDGVANFLKIISPVKSHKYVVDLWKRSQLKIGYWMQGQLLLGVIIGIFTYLGLLILGVKHALLLATLAAVFELIPVFGPILAAIPAIIVALVDGGATSAFLVTGWYLIIQQIENHLLYPLVVKKIVGVSPILVILSLVIGAKLAGFLGILLSVPIAAAIMEYVHDLEKERATINLE